MCQVVSKLHRDDSNYHLLHIYRTGVVQVPCRYPGQLSGVVQKFDY